MMPADPTTLIAALRVERTYSAREAAALLGRSYSWLDQRVRAGQFILPDGTVVRPLRTPGGYRRFTTQMLKDIAICCRNHHWFSWEKLQTTLLDLAVASYHDTGEYNIPS
jgi:hypothetical protein